LKVAMGHSPPGDHSDSDSDKLESFATGAKQPYCPSKAAAGFLPAAAFCHGGLGPLERRNIRLLSDVLRLGGSVLL
jgi:hypothetical protein